MLKCHMTPNYTSFHVTISRHWILLIHLHGKKKKMRPSLCNPARPGGHAGTSLHASSQKVEEQFACGGTGKRAKQARVHTHFRRSSLSNPMTGLDEGDVLLSLVSCSGEFEDRFFLFVLIPISC